MLALLVLKREGGLELQNYLFYPTLSTSYSDRRHNSLAPFCFLKNDVTALAESVTLNRVSCFIGGGRC